MRFFTKLAIDLGTYQTTVWKAGEGIVWQEPTVIALDAVSHKVLAIGNNAFSMLGKSPEYIEVIRPIVHGAISDYEATKQFIQKILQNILGASMFLGPEVLISVPSGTTQVEQKAVVDVATDAGARRVRLVDASIAGAIGAKIPISDVYGNMIVLHGAGVTESAVIALGGIVGVKSTRLGSADIDQKISDFLTKEFNIYIGDQTAAELKKQYLSALRPKHPTTFSILGRDTVTSLPKNVELTSDKLYEGIKDIFPQLSQSVVAVIETIPPELVADIADRGIILVGGGSQLMDFSKYLSGLLSVAVHVGFEPELSVIKGVGMILENIDTYERAIR